MSKTAFLFAGQGAAYTGMGKDLCEQYKAARMVFEAGSDILGFDIARLCFEADNDTLAQTGNTQPAIFTMSLASCAVLEEKGVRADCAAGFSLGEISALAAAGAVELEDGFRIIQARGACMQKAAERTGGAMYAILGLDSARIQEVCEETAGYVLPVNYNSPAQTVIAGEEEPAQAAADACLAAGAKRAVRLAVNAGFHSALMAEAAEEFKRLIHAVSFTAPEIPVYSNMTGDPIQDFSDMPSYLARQIVSPVQWRKTVEHMAQAGVTRAIEHGPGKVLCGLVRKISPEIQTANCDSSQNLTSLLEKM